MRLPDPRTILKEFILWLLTSSRISLLFMVPVPCMDVKRFNVCDVIEPGRRESCWTWQGWRGRDFLGLFTGEELRLFSRKELKGKVLVNDLSRQIAVSNYLLHAR
jgi:hypothetical protein